MKRLIITLVVLAMVGMGCGNSNPVTKEMVENAINENIAGPFGPVEIRILNQYILPYPETGEDMYVTEYENTNNTSFIDPYGGTIQFLHRGNSWYVIQSY